MSKIENQYVVQSNDLVRHTKWVINKVPLKLFKALVSCIDTKNPPQDNTITIRKSELVRILGSEKKDDQYQYLKNQIRTLQTSIKVQDNDKHEHYVSLLTDIYWEKDNDRISVTFHKDVMTYLLVNTRFLQYTLDKVLGFTTKYGIIIYEQLMALENQYHTRKYIIPMEELRYVTNTEDKYSLFSNFEKKVLIPGVEDLNQANVEILAKYEKVKKGRCITAIKFTIRKRTSCLEKTYDEISNPHMLTNE